MISIISTPPTFHSHASPSIPSRKLSFIDGLECMEEKEKRLYPKSPHHLHADFSPHDADSESSTDADDDDSPHQQHHIVSSYISPYTSHRRLQLPTPLTSPRKLSPTAKHNVEVQLADEIARIKSTPELMSRTLTCTPSASSHDIVMTRERTLTCTPSISSHDIVMTRERPLTCTPSISHDIVMTRERPLTCTPSLSSHDIIMTRERPHSLGLPTRTISDTSHVIPKSTSTSSLVRMTQTTNTIFTSTSTSTSSHHRTSSGTINTTSHTRTPSGTNISADTSHTRTPSGTHHTPSDTSGSPATTPTSDQQTISPFSPPSSTPPQSRLSSQDSISNMSHGVTSPTPAIPSIASQSNLASMISAHGVSTTEHTHPHHTRHASTTSTATSMHIESYHPHTTHTDGTRLTHLLECESIMSLFKQQMQCDDAPKASHIDYIHNNKHHTRYERTRDYLNTYGIRYHEVITFIPTASQHQLNHIIRHHFPLNDAGQMIPTVEPVQHVIQGYQHREYGVHAYSNAYEAHIQQPRNMTSLLACKILIANNDDVLQHNTHHLQSHQHHYISCTEHISTEHIIAYNRHQILPCFIIRYQPTMEKLNQHTCGCNIM